MMAQQPESELQKMVSGKMYDAMDPQLKSMRADARNKARKFNETPNDEERVEILRSLLGSTGEKLYIEPTFRCDYGCNIHVGENFYMNFNCVILDCAPVTIGNNVMCGPAVQIYTATHPVDAIERNKGPEYAKPVSIGDNVWIGGGAIICPGVTIHRNSTVAAGAVVVKDVPENVVVGGNPAKIIKSLAATVEKSTNNL